MLLLASSNTFKIWSHFPDETSEPVRWVFDGLTAPRYATGLGRSAHHETTGRTNEDGRLRCSTGAKENERGTVRLGVRSPVEREDSDDDGHVTEPSDCPLRQTQG